MIVYWLATLLHNVESLRLAISGEVLVDAGGTRLGGDWRIIWRGSFFPVLFHLRHGVPRAMKFIGQTNPMYIQIVQSICLVANIVFFRQLEFNIVVGIAKPFVIISDMFCHWWFLVRMKFVISDTILVTLASCIELIQYGFCRRRLLLDSVEDASSPSFSLRPVNSNDKSWQVYHFLGIPPENSGRSWLLYHRWRICEAS